MTKCLLQQTQLEACYREATSEIDNAFEITASDRLEDEEEYWFNKLVK